MRAVNLRAVEARIESVVGDMSGGGPPGPISNPAVKPASADGSMRFAACESRPSPTILSFCFYSFLFFSTSVEYHTELCLLRNSYCTGSFCVCGKIA